MDYCALSKLRNVRTCVLSSQQNDQENDNHHDGNDDNGRRQPPRRGHAHGLVFFGRGVGVDCHPLLHSSPSTAGTHSGCRRITRFSSARSSCAVNAALVILNICPGDCQEPPHRGEPLDGVFNAANVALDLAYRLPPILLPRRRDDCPGFFIRRIIEQMFYGNAKDFCDGAQRLSSHVLPAVQPVAQRVVADVGFVHQPLLSTPRRPSTT